jgi:hypothetical protein
MSGTMDPAGHDHGGLVHVGLSAWIIQDGNYGDFECGDTEFALELWPVSLASSATPAAPSARHREGGYHAVQGRVVAVFDEAWVVDVGLLAFEAQRPPAWAKPGVFFSGELYLGVDPFFYFEELSELPQFPALMYAWRIARIALETTPWLTRREGMHEVRYRDATHTSFRPVERTDAWHDDGQHGHYVLEAEVTGGPTRTFVNRRWR